jgi:plastocyanin
VRALLLLGVLALPLAAPMPGALAGTTHVVHMRFQAPVLFVFESEDTGTSVLIVAVGDAVLFQSDDVSHRAVNGLDDVAVGGVAPLHLGAFDTGIIPQGSSAAVTITEPGLYPYYCAVGLHRFTGMRGLLLAQ